MYSYEQSLYYRNNFQSRPRKSGSGGFSLFKKKGTGRTASRNSNAPVNNYHQQYRSARKPSIVKTAGGFAFNAVKFGVLGTGSAIKAGSGAIAGAMKAAKEVKSGKIKFVIGPSFVIGSLVLVAVILGVLQLAHFNMVATKGYELRRLEADRQQLMSQYEIKNMKLAQAKSMNNIAQTDLVSAMRHPNNVEFVRGNSALAYN